MIKEEIKKDSFWNVLREREQNEEIIELRSVDSNFFYYIQKESNESIINTLKQVKALSNIPSEYRKEGMDILKSLLKEKEMTLTGEIDNKKIDVILKDCKYEFDFHDFKYYNKVNNLFSALSILLECGDGQNRFHFINEMDEKILFDKDIINKSIKDNDELDMCGIIIGGMDTYGDGDETFLRRLLDENLYTENDELYKKRYSQFNKKCSEINILKHMEYKFKNDIQRLISTSYSYASLIDGIIVLKFNMLQEFGLYILSCIRETIMQVG